MWLLRTAGDAPSRILRLPPGSTRTIGRGPLADFVIDAVLLSRVHCRLVATSTSLAVEDLESTNGVYLNDSRVKRATLEDGDRLRIGRLELVVSLEEQTPDSVTRED